MLHLRRPREHREHHLGRRAREVEAVGDRHELDASAPQLVDDLEHVADAAAREPVQAKDVETTHAARSSVDAQAPAAYSPSIALPSSRSTRASTSVASPPTVKPEYIALPSDRSNAAHGPWFCGARNSGCL